MHLILTHPEGRSAEPVHCINCGRFAHLQGHGYDNGRYQSSHYVCRPCGLKFTKQLEKLEE